MAGSVLECNVAFLLTNRMMDTALYCEIQLFDIMAGPALWLAKVAKTDIRIGAAVHASLAPLAGWKDSKR